MTLWGRKKTKKNQQTETTDHAVGDFGSAELKLTQQPGDRPILDITLSITPEYTLGIQFEQKREERGLEHPETLHALHLYALSLGELPNRRNDAVELLDWLVHARANDEENRLLTLNDLAASLQDIGYLTQAEQRLREALTGWERLRGQDDAQTLSTSMSLGRVLLDLKRGDEAEGLMRDTVARYTRTFGPTHHDTLRSRNVLAGSLRGSPDRLAEAEGMYRAMLADLDDDSDLALAVRNNLAAVLIHQGKYPEASAAFRELIDRSSQLKGTEDPHTLSAQHNYATVLSRLDHLPEAQTLMTEVLQGYRRIYGPGHAETLDVQVDLAAIIANQGRNDEAVPILRDAIEGYRSTHGPDHPRVRELAHAITQLGG